MSDHTKKGIEKRIKRLNCRINQEYIIFPDKRNRPLNRLVKKAKRQKPKTLKQQIDEWEAFIEKTK